MSKHRSSGRFTEAFTAQSAVKLPAHNAGNFTAVVLAVFCLILLQPSATRADEGAGLLKVGLTADDSKAPGAAKESKPSLGKPQAASARSGTLMRCWNYGRLVYESPVGGFIASSPNNNVVTIPGSPQKQVLDMRSGLCVIE
jgi:hypothetical protein